MTINRCRLFLQIWQCTMPTLSQWLESFPTESRAEILPRYRRDYPLQPPINRGSIGDLREEKLGSKVSQKTIFSSGFCTFFLFFSLHRGLQPPPPSSPVFQPSPSPQKANTTTSRPPWATVDFSLVSLAPLARFFFFNLLPLPLVTISATASATVLTQPLTVSPTSSRLNSSPAAKHTPPVPFSPADFLLLLSSCFATCNQFQPPVSPPHDILRGQTTTAPGSLLLQILQPFGCMQNVNSNCSHSAA